MKILWVNPGFLDYRIPVYKKLFDFTSGNFSLISSKNRVPQRVFTKLQNEIGEHLIGMSNEKIFYKPVKDKLANTEDEFANKGFALPYQPGLYKIISKVNADIIIAEGFFQWTPIALINARLNRRKFIITYERTAHTERNCPRWRTLYRKLISKFVNGFSVNGHLTKEYLIQLGIKEDKIFIGGMSADSESLAKKVSAYTIEEKEVLKCRLSIRNGLTYLYIGRISKRKGVINLLNAWKKHVETYADDSLLIVGTGPLLEQYSEEFSRYQSIKFAGGIDYESIYRYYSIADVFVMPTLEDNWSLVVPEAMACGLPIACSIYNGCHPELVHKDVNGKLFDPLNEETILDTLGYFHRRDLKLMGSESIKIEKEYSAHSVAENIYNSCRRLID